MVTTNGILKGFGAPSQKTRLLGGVAQILIYPRPSSCLADVRLFVRTNPNTSESWVIDSGASFHATLPHVIFQSYVKGELGKVYLRDDKSCDIIRKVNVIVILFSGSS